jgi:hypothetical protein
MTKPAGWYRDDEAAGALRYWDGETWADQRAAEPPAAKKSRLDWMVFSGLSLAIVVIIGGVAAAVTLAMRMNLGEQTATAQATNADAPTPTTLPAASAPTATVVETTAPGGTGSEETQAAGPGQEVRDGQFAFVVGDIERVDAITHPEQPEYHKEAQGEFVIVHVNVTNLGATPQPFYASFSKLSDGSTVYESDYEAWLYLGNTLTSLTPGATLETVLVFDVPKGTELQSVELHDSPSSRGATVGL